MKEFFNKLEKKKIITIVVAIILAVIIIPSGIKCIVYKESPVQLVADTFTPASKQIVGNWQGENALTAYVFSEDGTFESYISSFSYKGQYEIKGSRLILKKSNLSGTVEYKVKINGDNLTMKLVAENGVEPLQKTKLSFKKVDSLVMKSFGDILNSLTEDN